LAVPTSSKISSSLSQLSSSIHITSNRERHAPTSLVFETKRALTSSSSTPWSLWLSLPISSRQGFDCQPLRPYDIRLHRSFSV
jgi:hypothetical protein